MTDQLQTTRLRLRGGADVLGAIPYLLGFQPSESIVLLAVEAGRVELTARFDLDLCLDQPQLHDRLKMLRCRFPKAEWVLVAISEREELADQALTLLEIEIGCGQLVDSIRADGTHFWSRLNSDPRGCPAEGQRYDELGSLVAAEAVYSGLSVLSDRAALADLVGGPNGAEELAAGLSAMARVLQIPKRKRRGGAGRARLLELIETGLDDPTRLGLDELAELADLTSVDRLRDQAWLQLRRCCADRQVALWQRVVAAIPPALALPALCLLGVAGWLAGNGALQVVCLERGLEIDPTFPPLWILEDIHLFAIPPSHWDSWLEGHSSNETAC